MISEQAEEAQDAAATRSALDNSVNGLGGADDRISQQLDEVTSAAADAAKDYRSWMLEQMKVSISAALDYANGLASASLQPAFSSRAAGRAGGEKENSGTAKDERVVADPASAAEQYRAKAFELMTANVNATLEYAKRLADVRSPAEFVELSASHARKNLELIMAHSAALGALSRSLTTNNAERLTASIARALRPR